MLLFIIGAHGRALLYLSTKCRPAANPRQMSLSGFFFFHETALTDWWPGNCWSARVRTLESDYMHTSLTASLFPHFFPFSFRIWGTTQQPSLLTACLVLAFKRPKVVVLSFFIWFWFIQQENAKASREQLDEIRSCRERFLWLGDRIAITTSWGKTAAGKGYWYQLT